MALNRSLISRTILGIIAGITIFITVLPSSAAINLISYSLTCSSAYMNATSGDATGNDFGPVTIRANGVIIVDDPEGVGPYDIDDIFTYSLPAGDYEIIMVWESSEGDVIVSENVSCGADIADYGRICFGPGEVAAAIYLYPDGLEIYSIEDDAGVLSISISNETLYSTATDPSGDVAVATTDDVLPTTLYRQIDGNFRVVVGPEPVEGKTYECVFNVICAKTRSWLPGQEPYGSLDLSICEQSFSSSHPFT